MSAFVEECRREWRRLGVPDLMAEEMAAELEADLAEAEADGISAAEMLGESDPRRFAATWARERGLVSEPPPKRRRRAWPWIAAAAVLFVLPLSWLALQNWGTGHATSAPPVRVKLQRIALVRVPNLVGMKVCEARRAAVNAGLTVNSSFRRHRCGAVVVAQAPAPGARVTRHSPQAAVKLRLRG
jgi:hypothetical protein